MKTIVGSVLEKVQVYPDGSVVAIASARHLGSPRPRAPVNVVLPAITGTPVVGHQLSVSNGTWTSDTTPRYTYQWRRGGTNIAGATGATYTPIPVDADWTISAVVTAINPAGSLSAAAAGIVALSRDLSFNFTAQSYFYGNTIIPALASAPLYSFVRTGTQTASDADWTTDDFAGNAPAINGLGYHAYGPLTNNLPYSQDLSQGWTASSGALAVNPNIATAPNGTLTADELRVDSLGGAGFPQYTKAAFSFLSGGKKCFIFFAKAAGTNWLRVRVSNFVHTTFGAVNPEVYFNIGTGVVGTTTSGATGRVHPLSNGWFACIIEVDLDGTDLTGALLLQLATADNTALVTRDGVAGVYVWQAQTLDGGGFDGPVLPMIVTAAAGASTGSGHLKVAASLPAGDFIAWAAVSMTDVIQGDQTFFTLSDGTSSNNLRVRTGLSAYLNVPPPVAGGVTQSAPPSILNFVQDGRSVVMVRSLNGVMSLAGKKADGTIVIGGGVAAANPAATLAHIATSRSGTIDLNGRVKSFDVRSGAYDDAAITAILQGA